MCIYFQTASWQYIKSGLIRRAIASSTAKPEMMGWNLSDGRSRLNIRKAGDVFAWKMGNEEKARAQRKDSRRKRRLYTTKTQQFRLSGGILIVFVKHTAQFNLGWDAPRALWQWNSSMELSTPTGLGKAEAEERTEYSRTGGRAGASWDWEGCLTGAGNQWDRGNLASMAHTGFYSHPFPFWQKPARPLALLRPVNKLEPYSSEKCLGNWWFGWTWILHDRCHACSC